MTLIRTLRRLIAFPMASRKVPTTIKPLSPHTGKMNKRW
jgi:hypothetical protein